MSLIVLLLILFCPALLPALPAPSCAAVVASQLNVLNNEGEVIAVLDIGTQINVIGIVRDVFARIDEGGLVAYVHYPSGLIIRPSCFVRLARLSNSELPQIDASLYTP